MKRVKFQPKLIAKSKRQVITDVGGVQFTISPEAWIQIKDEKFFWDKKRKTYPIRARRDLKSLKTLVYGGRCYTISTDLTDLRPSNLMSTCSVEDIGKDMIRVHIGNGMSFVTDANQRDYVLSHKWSILELKPGYFYVCYMSKESGKRRLHLFHRYVAGATETSQHVDHWDFDTKNNTRANLKIVSLYENISRHNPAKAGKRRKK